MYGTLRFLYDRLINVHKENEDTDYMIKFKAYIDELKPKTTLTSLYTNVTDQPDGLCFCIIKDTFGENEAIVCSMSHPDALPVSIQDGKLVEGWGTS